MCLEDTVDRILERYVAYNGEIGSYAVEYMGRPLRKDWDLKRNGVVIEKRDGTVYDYVPTLMVYRQRYAKSWCRHLRSLEWLNRINILLDSLQICIAYEPSHPPLSKWSTRSDKSISQSTIVFLLYDSVANSERRDWNCARFFPFVWLCRNFGFEFRKRAEDF